MEAKEVNTQSAEKGATRPVDDLCPDWAITMIDQLRQIEIHLGNIPKALEWESSHLKDVTKKVFAEDQGVITEHHSEVLFGKIVSGLSREGFSAAEIEVFMNARIGYKGAPVYCSVEEINEVLG